MIKISQREADLVREKYPQVHIRRTVHGYYMEEAKKAMILIAQDRRSRQE